MTALIGAVGFTDVRSVWAEAPADAPIADGVLLLRNGGVLQGEITPVGSRYLVTRGQSQVDVAASQVSLGLADLRSGWRLVSTAFGSAP